MAYSRRAEDSPPPSPASHQHQHQHRPPQALSSELQQQQEQQQQPDEQNHSTISDKASVVKPKLFPDGSVMTPSLSSIMSAYESDGNGDHELLKLLLITKAREDERLAAWDLFKTERLRAANTLVWQHVYWQSQVQAQVQAQDQSEAQNQGGHAPLAAAAASSTTIVAATHKLATTVPYPISPSSNSSASPSPIIDHKFMVADPQKDEEIPDTAKNHLQPQQQQQQRGYPYSPIASPSSCRPQPPPQSLQPFSSTSLSQLTVPQAAGVYQYYPYPLPFSGVKDDYPQQEPQNGLESTKSSHFKPDESSSSVQTKKVASCRSRSKHESSMTPGPENDDEDGEEEEEDLAAEHESDDDDDREDDNMGHAMRTRGNEEVDQLEEDTDLSTSSQFLSGVDRDHREPSTLQTIRLKLAKGIHELSTGGEPLTKHEQTMLALRQKCERNLQERQAVKTVSSSNSIARQHQQQQPKSTTPRKAKIVANEEGSKRRKPATTNTSTINTADITIASLSPSTSCEGNDEPLHEPATARRKRKVQDGSATTMALPGKRSRIVVNVTVIKPEPSLSSSSPDTKLRASPEVTRHVAQALASVRRGGEGGTSRSPSTTPPLSSTSPVGMSNTCRTTSPTQLLLKEPTFPRRALGGIPGTEVPSLNKYSLHHQHHQHHLAQGRQQQQQPRNELGEVDSTVYPQEFHQGYHHRHHHQHHPSQQHAWSNYRTPTSNERSSDSHITTTRASVPTMAIAVAELDLASSSSSSSIRDQPHSPPAASSTSSSTETVSSRIMKCQS